MPTNATAMLDRVQELALAYGIPIGLKILGALLVWIIGRIIIAAVRSIIRRALTTRKIDETLKTYIDSALGVLFTILLLLTVLSVFGVETTSFAGLIAAGGIAIGMAWSGLLSNFAAGVFMVVLRPFKVGDFITAGGVTGTVIEIGLFVTTINTMDNIRTFTGNSKIFGDTIQNFTANPYRRVELTAPLAFGVDPKDAITRLKDRISKIPNVVKEPAVFIEVVEVNGGGTVLAVRPFCHNDHYWDVYFATLQAISEEFKSAGYPQAASLHNIRTLS